MKISYFFNISVVFGRSDMKQKTNYVKFTTHTFIQHCCDTQRVITKNVSINQIYLVVEMFHELFT